ncbi:TPA: hypothetical protein N0F65_001796 [Lagenidium giganteum]|uniref:Uncharacterized protein n=1 Tax=Lagenidium giganteum TaxID=4803 RepID=A0AAV2Z4S3_9STRA|nr:TPA: hypothetical protein N0F65_001796 [Lagenidium giganteum]
MYNGASARIYNPRPDPLERGPPKRVNREESHIGERIAASKKRISWKFTLGDAETTHEVVLTHSIMSYKKVWIGTGTLILVLVEFDGRQMHMSSTATPGDWSFVMVLDGSNNVIEVRINDVETEEVPKYDLVIDRVPFRRWDVFRRRKGPITPSPYGYPQSHAPTSGFATHRWGPGGMAGPNDQQGSTTRDEGPKQRSNSFRSSRENRRPSQQSGQPGPDFQNPHGTGYQPQAAAGHHAGQSTSPNVQPQQATASPPRPAPSQPKQPEINLIDDSAPQITMSAQSLLFDPLASYAQPAPAPAQNPRTASSPNFTNNFANTASSPSQPTQNYVDPFGGVTQSLSAKPVAQAINLDPLASQNSSYLQANRPAPQQQQQQAMFAAPNGQYAQGAGAFASPPRGYQNDPMPTAPMSNVSLGGMQMSMQQQQAPTGGTPPTKTGTNVNYNISHFMSPVEVNNVRSPQDTKTINIDPFAGMGTR